MTGQHVKAKCRTRSRDLFLCKKMVSFYASVRFLFDPEPGMGSIARQRMEV